MRSKRKKDTSRNRFLDNTAAFDFGSSSSSRKKKKLRRIPIKITLMIIFADVKTFIGIVFSLMGGLFIVIFGSLIITTGSYGISDDDPIVYGRITAVSPTSTSVNDQLLYKYTYTFKLQDGTEYRGDVRKYFGIANPGDSILIQYSAANPEKSLLADYPEGLMPWWVLLIISIFPLIGVLMVLTSIPSIKRTLNTLRCGETAWGTFERKEATGASVNKQVVYRMFFKFTAADGREYTAVGNTHHTHRLLDEEQEMIIYDPENPSNAFPVDAYSPKLKRFVQKNF